MTAHKLSKDALALFQQTRKLSNAELNQLAKAAEEDCHDIKSAASAMGRKGGAAGRGASKRRSREHYSAAGKASAKARAAKKAASD
jgi:hypothetical protein